MLTKRDGKQINIFKIFRGGILKKIEVEVWYAGKKRMSTREKFKGDVY
jgi:hypothetical protein